MEENTKTEQHLSEELLQQITGGSGEGTKSARDYQLIAKGERNLGRIAQETGFLTQAAQHYRASFEAAVIAKNPSRGVGWTNVRQETPQHTTASPLPPRPPKR
jgi:hypothetical protein